MVLVLREGPGEGASTAISRPRGSQEVGRGGRSWWPGLRLTKNQQLAQMLTRGKTRAGVAFTASEPAAQVLEGEMSPGSCLFSLARLEAVSNPHSVALKAASAAQTLLLL